MQTKSNHKNRSNVTVGVSSLAAGHGISDASMNDVRVKSSSIVCEQKHGDISINDGAAPDVPDKNVLNAVTTKSDERPRSQSMGPSKTKTKSSSSIGYSASFSGSGSKNNSRNKIKANQNLTATNVQNVTHAPQRITNNHYYSFNF
uniref:Uncharacterized protein n=1 Tax=Panagrolaimus sp. ES5 TaxID=591445 RepID=A0AC34FUV3_9BILA